MLSNFLPLTYSNNWDGLAFKPVTVVKTFKAGLRSRFCFIATHKTKFCQLYLINLSLNKKLFFLSLWLILRLLAAVRPQVVSKYGVRMGVNEGDEVRIEDLRDLRDLRSRCAALHIPPRLPRGPGKAFLIASDGFWCVQNSCYNIISFLS